MRFQKRDATETTHIVTVPPRASRKVAVGADVPGMAEAEFSTVVESDADIVADRQMWWNRSTAYGTHAETGIKSPAVTWYFAEGATHSNFDLFYLLQNPHPTPADVRIRYLLPVGPPLEKRCHAPPRAAPISG